MAARVTRGGHNVPREKLGPRYARSLENLARAIQALPHVIVYDNSDLADPNRRIAEYRRGRQVFAVKPLPPWFRRGIAGYVARALDELAVSGPTMSDAAAGKLAAEAKAGEG